MTQQHFEAIARGLANAGASYSVCDSVAREIARFNPAFDRLKFLVACGACTVHEPTRLRIAR